MDGGRAPDTHVHGRSPLDDAGQRKSTYASEIRYGRVEDDKGEKTVDTAAASSTTGTIANVNSSDEENSLDTSMKHHQDASEGFQEALDRASCNAISSSVRFGDGAGERLMLGGARTPSPRRPVAEKGSPKRHLSPHPATMKSTGLTTPLLPKDGMRQASRSSGKPADVWKPSDGWKPDEGWKPSSQKSSANEIEEITAKNEQTSEEARRTTEEFYRKLAVARQSTKEFYQRFDEIENSWRTGKSDGWKPDEGWKPSVGASPQQSPANKIEEIAAKNEQTLEEARRTTEEFYRKLAAARQSTKEFYQRFDEIENSWRTGKPPDSSSFSPHIRRSIRSRSNSPSPETRTERNTNMETLSSASRSPWPNRKSSESSSFSPQVLRSLRSSSHSTESSEEKWKEACGLPAERRSPSPNRRQVSPSPENRLITYSDSRAIVQHGSDDRNKETSSIGASDSEADVELASLPPPPPPKDSPSTTSSQSGRDKSSANSRTSPVEQSAKSKISEGVMARMNESVRAPFRKGRGSEDTSESNRKMTSSWHAGQASLSSNTSGISEESAKTFPLLGHKERERNANHRKREESFSSSLGSRDRASPGSNDNKTTSSAVDTDNNPGSSSGMHYTSSADCMDLAAGDFSEEVEIKDAENGKRSEAENRSQNVVEKSVFSFDSVEVSDVVTHFVGSPVEDAVGGPWVPSERGRHVRAEDGHTFRPDDNNEDEEESTKFSNSHGMPLVYHPCSEKPRIPQSPVLSPHNLVHVKDSFTSASSKGLLGTDYIDQEDSVDDVEERQIYVDTNDVAKDLTGRESTTRNDDIPLVYSCSTYDQSPRSQFVSLEGSAFSPSSKAPYSGPAQNTEESMLFTRGDHAESIPPISYHISGSSEDTDEEWETELTDPSKGMNAAALAGVLLNSTLDGLSGLCHPTLKSTCQ